MQVRENVTCEVCCSHDTTSVQVSHRPALVSAKVASSGGRLQPGPLGALSLKAHHSGRKERGRGEGGREGEEGEERRFAVRTFLKLSSIRSCTPKISCINVFRYVCCETRENVTCEVCCSHLPSVAQQIAISCKRSDYNK